MERKLVESARQGDRDAFGELAVALGDRLHAVAHRILRDRDLAGDATQEALVKIWQDLPRLRDVERFDGWAYRVVVNVCRDQIRRRRPRSIDLLDFDGSLPDASAAIADRDQIDRAFTRLSVDHRSVVILHYYLDLPMAQIADIVNAPVGTVRSRLHYAKSALRAAIDAQHRAFVNGERSA